METNLRTRIIFLSLNFNDSLRFYSLLSTFDKELKITDKGSEGTIS